MVVGVSNQPAFSASAPRKLLELPQNFFKMIDVTPDGRRFAIIVSSVQGLTTTQVNVVNGWFDELNEKVSASR